MPKATTTTPPVPPKKKLVLSRDTVRSLNDPVAAAAATWCECYSKCTCTTDLC